MASERIALMRTRQRCRSSAVRLLFVGTDGNLVAS